MGSRTVFTVSEQELGAILQSRSVVGTPVTRVSYSSGYGWQRVIDVGQPIGTNSAGQALSRVRVITDRMGNLITAFPIP